MSPERRPQEWMCPWGSGGGWEEEPQRPWSLTGRWTSHLGKPGDTNWHWDLGSGCGRTYSTRSLGERRTTEVLPLGRHGCHGILRAI